MIGHTPYYINVDGRLMDVNEPQVMGILNVTPNTGHADSYRNHPKEYTRRVKEFLSSVH